MTSDTDEAFRLLESYTYKVLKEGQAIEDFYQRLKSLRTSDPNRARKLEAICARLRFVEQLSYIAKPELLLDYQGQVEYQFDRLKTYLALTTLDIAAEKTATGYQYHAWLNHSLKEDPKQECLIEAIDALTDSRTIEDTTRLLADWTSTLYEAVYLPEAGFGINFRKLITDAPPWLVKWLAEAYILVGKDEDPVKYYLFPNELNWFTRKIEERCKEISKYLYRLRNKYTHTVEYRPPKEQRRRDMRVAVINGTEYGFDSIHENDDTDTPIEGHVGLRTDIAESDVVRLVVVARLRKWLGINDDDEMFLSLYLARARYRHLGYLFLKELQSNRGLVQNWCLIHLRLFPLIHDYSLRKLNNSVAKEFLAVNRELHPTRDISLASPDGYLANIERINLRLAELNDQYDSKQLTPWEKRRIELEIIEGIVDSDDARWLVQHSYDIEQDLFENLNNSNY